MKTNESDLSAESALQHLSHSPFHTRMVGAIWSSVSCSRKLQHAVGGAGD